mgnify:CR=1 FL=1
MGFSQEILNDTILNVVGYLIAGALLTLLYSAFTNRHRRVRPATNPTPHADDRQTAPESTRAEFVDLRSVGTPERQPGNATYSSVAHRERQRNRAGLVTDAAGRPLDATGAPAWNRLYAVGAVLARQDWMRQKCGSGLSAGTAWAAVDAIAGDLGGPGPVAG